MSVAYALIKLWRQRGYAVNLHTQNELITETAQQNQELCMLKWSKKTTQPNLNTPKASESKIFVLGVGPSSLTTLGSMHYRLQIEPQDSPHFQNILDSNAWKVSFDEP